jgi:hypothetical protein
MTVLDRRPLTRLPRRALLAAPAVVAGPLFLTAATVRSAVHAKDLEAWGWTPLDHHGVPWPSSLAVVPGGWVQSASFAGTGGALIALSNALPRGGRRLALAACGTGLVAAAFPLDVPVGDPAALMSWVQSWPAVVHVDGFFVAGAAGLAAIAASRRRGDVGFAALLALAAALGGTPGWYAYLTGFLGWATVVALKVIRS